MLPKVLLIQLCFFSIFAFSQNRYWVGNSTYLTNFNSITEINEWNLVEDNGTGLWGLSGNGTAILKMDDAAGLYANRIFNVNGASPWFLPLDATNGIVEFNLISVTGGTQNYFLQVQEFNSSGVYLSEQNLLFGTNTTGYFSVDLSTITWNASTTQIRFMIGGSNFSAQQGTIEFDYFSYSNSNKNWNNSSNWSLSSGGAGGATPPGIGDTAIFDGFGNFNGICFLDAPTSVGTLRISGYNGSIDLRGNSLTVLDEATLQTGQITNSGPSTNVTLNCTNAATFSGTAFNVDINGSVNRLFMNGSTFNNSLIINKVGPGFDESEGGNIFNGTTEITCNNAGASIRLATLNGDIFNGEVIFNQTLGTIEPAYNNTTTFYSNITNNGASAITFGAGNGITSFSGNSLQSISATTAPTFNRIKMNKTSNALQLNTEINIGIEATFVTGIINSTTSNDIVFVNNSTSIGANTSSYVDGPVTKIGDDLFNFPTGDNGSFKPISMSEPSSTDAKFRAEYFNSDPGILFDTSLKDLTLDSINSCEYWLFDRTLGTDNVSLSLFWVDSTTSCEISNLNELSVARWNGAKWKDHGNGGTTGNSNAGSITTAGAVTSFSPFTLAFASDFPLPIGIVSFNAELSKTKVVLNWITSSEINNDYFTIEKSKDLISWIAINKKDGAGNSSTSLKYSDVDNNPYSGLSYYRLKQTDFNGNSDYSKALSISNSKIDIISYPNPFTNFLHLENLNESDIVTVTTVNGQTMYHGNTTKINTSKWSRGIYLVFITDTLGIPKSQCKAIK